MKATIRIMTLNLHTYQEIEKDKFNNLEEFFIDYRSINEKIAKTIKDKDIDIICLQEAAQHKAMPEVMKSGEIKIRKYNAILELQRILRETYKLEYNFIWDWSHYGWNVWEEGIGILTRHRIKEVETRYVSSEANLEDIFSRKVAKAVLDFNGEVLEVYSAHLNWWEKGFKTDIDNLLHWISEKGHFGNFILAGDFNNPAGAEGYNYLMSKTVNGRKLIDVDYMADADNFNRATIRGDVFNSTQRIDYIITGDSKELSVINCECIFTEDKDRVSDHMGLIAELKL